MGTILSCFTCKKLKPDDITNEENILIERNIESKLKCLKHSLTTTVVCRLEGVCSNCNKKINSQSYKYCYECAEKLNKCYICKVDLTYSKSVVIDHLTYLMRLHIYNSNSLRRLIIEIGEMTEDKKNELVLNGEKITTEYERIIEECKNDKYNSIIDVIYICKSKGLYV